MCSSLNSHLLLTYLYVYLYILLTAFWLLCSLWNASLGHLALPTLNQQGSQICKRPVAETSCLPDAPTSVLGETS